VGVRNRKVGGGEDGEGGEEGKWVCL